MTATAEDGTTWRWTPLPAGLFSGLEPAPGDPAWVAGPLRDGSFPAMLFFAGDRSRPRVSVGRRRAYRVATRVT